MCTALSYVADGHYFGRTLDLERSYDERVTVLPRQYPLSFRRLPPLPRHLAMVGVTAAFHPTLFYDGVNEKGLCMAGLNFPGHARYFPPAQGVDTVMPYELIPWILGQCATVEEARRRLERVQLGDVPFSEDLPLTPLHWLVADARQAVVVESVADGLHVYDNPARVLTNNPPFPQQAFGLEALRNLSPWPPKTPFAPYLSDTPYSRGTGGVGLPGDWSSASRFLRAAFALTAADSGDAPQGAVKQTFHILDTVAVPRGAVRLEDGAPVITVYAAVCDAKRGEYYIRPYDSPQTLGVSLFREGLDSTEAVQYPMPGTGAFSLIN